MDYNVGLYLIGWIAFTKYPEQATVLEVGDQRTLSVSLVTLPSMASDQVPE